VRTLNTAIRNSNKLPIRMSHSQRRKHAYSHHKGSE